MNQTLPQIDHLSELEAEGMYIIREVAAQFEKPALLFSGGKDSITMLHLAIKAFAPQPLPFPLVHVDTGHNFPETIAFRDALVKELGVELIVGYVQDSIDGGTAVEETGADASRIRLQTVTLLETQAKYGFDALLGGARRDEEKARAKERFFSHRDSFGQWQPRDQRPELWHIFNGKKAMGEHFRVFPISNWTETDIWEYLKREGVDLPNLYFSHERSVVNRNNVLLYEHGLPSLKEGEIPEVKTVRFRTIGDMTSTGAVESNADTIDKIIEELKCTRMTERGARADDKRSETSMEDRKKEGYF